MARKPFHYSFQFSVSFHILIFYRTLEFTAIIWLTFPKLPHIICFLFLLAGCRGFLPCHFARFFQSTCPEPGRNQNLKLKNAEKSRQTRIFDPGNFGLLWL